MEENKTKPVRAEKTREEVEAERKLRKAAKAAKKVKPGISQKGGDEKQPHQVDGNAASVNKPVENGLKPVDKKVNKTVVEKMESTQKKRDTEVANPGTSEIEVKVAAQENVTLKNEEKENKIKMQDNKAPKVAGSGEKSKAQLRAERRAIQEAQRAAKTEKAEKGKPLKDKQNVKPVALKENKPSVKIVTDVSAKEVEGILKNQDSKDKKAKKSVTWTKPTFYGHLPVTGKNSSITKELSLTSVQAKDIHPAVLTLGLHLIHGVVSGGNARAYALLISLRKVIKDCVPVDGKEFSRHLLRKIESNIVYLEQCRPFSVSMFNASRYVRSKCTQFGDQKLSPDQLKENLIDVIDSFIDVNIIKAGESIALNLCAALEYDTSNETYMTFGCSSTVTKVLLKLKEAGRKFHVVVVDSQTRPEGRTMVRRLANASVPCTLVLSEHVSFVMKYVDKILLGCSALLANSDVLSRAGTSQVALVAKSRNIPVLACCEMYKCANRAQTDAFGVNERGEPSILGGVDAPPTLNELDLAYDITPASFITAVVTESGIFPCDAAKAILRLKELDNDE